MGADVRSQFGCSMVSTVVEVPTVEFARYLCMCCGLSVMACVQHQLSTSCTIPDEFTMCVVRTCCAAMTGTLPSYPQRATVASLK